MIRDEHGIWGGYNIKERKQLRRELNINRRLVCQNCRRIFEKPANKAFATLYCSDRCRKS